MIFSNSTHAYLQILIAALSIALTSTVSFKAHSLQFDWFADSQSISYSEVAPIKQFADSLQGPKINRGTAAFSSNKIEMGQRFRLPSQKANISYSLFSRLDYSLEFTSETAYLFYAKENNISVANDTMRDVLLRANHIKATGITFAYTGWQIPNFTYTVGISYLNANEMIYGTIEGELTSLEDDPQGNLDLNYYYSEDIIFEREPTPLRAHGYTLDLSFLWHFRDDIAVSFTARDLFSKVYWDKQQQTVGNATSDRVSTDANGNTQVRAALMWRETNRDIEQQLPVQFTLNESYRVGINNRLLMEHYYYDGNLFHRFGYRRYLSHRSFIGAVYDITAKAYSIEMDLPYIRFGLRTDKADFEQAKLFGFYLAFYAPISF